MNVRSRSRARKSSAPMNADELARLLEAGREAFAHYDNEAAIMYFEQTLDSELLSAEQRATVCCLTAEALENLARYREAIEWLAEYEQTETRASLHPLVLGRVYLRLGSAYGYASDRPKAISYARNALALAEERDDLAEIGNCHQVLGRIYRAIGETKFAREHFQQALKHHRLTGNKVAIAYAYHGMALISISEGDFKSAQDYHSQALNLLDGNSPPLLFGNIFMNSAAILLLQEQGQEKAAVEFLRRAAHYFERARNKRLRASTYSNLGFNLLHLGEIQQARQALEASITLAREIGAHVALGNSLETLSELEMLSGNFAEAERLAREGIAVVQEVSGRWAESQAHLTLGRCHLLQNQYPQATAEFEHSLKVAAELNDRRGQLAAQLWLADVALAAGDLSAARPKLDELSGAVEKLSHTAMIGHLRELTGRLAAAEGNYDQGVHLLNQAVSIFEMVSNPYRTAVAAYHLGNVYQCMGENEKARTELDKARATFIRLESTPMLQRTNAALESFNRLFQSFVPASELPGQATALSFPATSGTKPPEFASVSNAALLRLVGAFSSRELLLHELTLIIQQDLALTPVVVYEITNDGTVVPLAWQGCDEAQAGALAGEITSAADQTLPTETARYEIAARDGAALRFLVGNVSRARYPHRQFIEQLIRIAEPGLELCTLRSQVRTIEGYETSADRKDIELPGMVYRSAAMRALVEEISRIRSSKVTALITGESGTGKEVIARAIHALSDRRDAPFVAFNCTVTPKEIIDSQLFGHRKGAFTGAHSDYQGVIRSAAGGTLFLDEVGDLALEAQPKLLRFLQEGEIQPLGETRPVRVSVRVIAATNCDLEKLVAEGKFREDLYYRLNVIRLHMPPLRERRDEIPALVTHMIGRYSGQEGKQDITIAPQALDLMLVYDWPGNVRQLANEIQRLIALTPAGGEITEDNLSPLIRHGGAITGGQKAGPASYYSGDFSTSTGPSIDSLLSRAAIAPSPEPDTQPAVSFQPVPGQKLADAVSQLETQMLNDAIARNRGNLRAVARELGLSPRGLYLKLERYQIEVKRD